MKKIVDYIILFLYSVCLYILWRLCQLGGIRYRLSILLPFFLLLAVFIAVKQIYRRKGFRAPFFKVRLFLFLGITALFGGQIIYTAIPYHGRLSWKIEELMNHRQAAFTHNNIYEDGIEGFLTDIDDKLTLPEELYVSDGLSVDFDGDGTIIGIEALIYGRDDSEKVRTFLVSYDAEKSDKIDVWVKGEANTDFNADKVLAPLSVLLSGSGYEKEVREWERFNNMQTYEILYYGKRTFHSETGLRFVGGDADGDGIAGSDDAIRRLEKGGSVRGYEVSLYAPDDETRAPVRYIIEPEYISQELLEKEHEADVVERAQGTEFWTVDDSDGKVYTFAQDDKKIGYRLVVADSAAGSRYYELEKTTDGGKNWKTVNSNPFMDNVGVAEGIEFFTQEYGFIGIQGASGERSQIYVTRDGGLTFTMLVLPMEQVKEVPEPGKSYGLTLEDYQYLSMPVREGASLSILVTSGEDEETGIAFYSSDNAETWNAAH